MIGIFDSGIGGLTVAKAVMELFPDLNVCYFGDTARTPYGTKSQETVTRYAVENTRFLLDQGAKIVVVACNTASAAAVPALKEQFDVPIFEVITPAVDMALFPRQSQTHRGDRHPGHHQQRHLRKADHGARSGAQGFQRALPVAGFPC